VFIAICDFSGKQAMRRLTFGGHNTNSLWTHDGQRIIFQSDRDGDAGLFWQRADGSGSPERLTTSEKGVLQIADAASPDGMVPCDIPTGPSSIRRTGFMADRHCCELVY
jgi:Tol biopolymer transport system component